MNKFRNKSGWLTPYGLACGYIEQTEINEVRVTLWYEGGNCYHVRIAERQHLGKALQSPCLSGDFDGRGDLASKGRG